MNEQTVVNQMTMSEQAYKIISSYILNGTWGPGKSIKIRDTARLLNISEMPVREAVKTLVENGLAVHHAHKGCFVTKLSVQELNDFYKVRILLETEAARLGAENISAKDLSAMRQYWLLLQKAAKNSDSLSVLKKDADFLLTLYNSCGNKVLVDQIQSIWQRVQPYRILWTQQSLQSGFYNWKVKKEILQAAELKNGNLASELTLNSLTAAMDFMEKRIN